MKSKPSNWLIVKEVGEYVNKKYRRHWSNSYVYLLMNAGKLKFFRIGNTRVVLSEDIDAVIQSFKKGPPPVLKVVEE